MPSKLIFSLLFLCLCALPLFAQESDSLLADAMLQRAKKHQATGQFDLALSAADSSVSAFSSLYGRRHLKTAEALEVILKVKNTLGDYAPAMELAQEVLRIREELLPPEHVQIAYALNNIGIISSNMGDSRTGVQYKFRGLAILEANSKQITEDKLKSYLNIGASYMELSENDSAVFYLEKGLRMTIDYFDSDENLYTGYYFSNLGIVYEDMGRYEKAKALKEKALAIRLKINGEMHPDVGTEYANLAKSYQLAGDIQTAIQLNKKALHILQQLFGDTHPLIGQLLNNMGAAYSDIHDYQTAADYVRRALDIYSQVFGETHPYIAQSYNNLAAIMENLGDHEQSILFYEKSIQIYEQTLGPDDPTTASTRANMGVPLERLGRYDEAIRLYQAAIIPLEKYYGSGHFYLSFPYTGLGNVYASQGKYELALQAFDTALSIKKQALGPVHPEVAISQINSSNIKTYMGLTGQAIADFQGIVDMTSSLQDLLPKAQYHFLRSRAFEGTGVAYAKQYAADGKKESLQRSREFTLAALEEVKSQKLLEYSEASERTIGASLMEIAENGLRICFEMSKFEPDAVKNCFLFSEIVKAFQLLESMQASKAAAFAGLPADLIQTERNLKLDIHLYEKLIFENAQNDSLVQEWRKVLIEKREALETLMATLKNNHPAYFTEKYNLATITIPQVQQQLLHPGEALLEYFVGDSLIYIFVITSGDLHLAEVKKDFPLQTWIDTLRHNIYQNVSTGSAAYVQAATDLYDKLVRPVQDRLPERLIVIPDGVLGYIPFEALLTGRPKDPKRFDKHPFMLLKHQISYCYSATLLAKMEERKHQQSPGFHLLAFAPHYTGNPADVKVALPLVLSNEPADSSSRSAFAGMDELPHSGTEVRSIREITSEGDVFYGKDATEERFVEMAGRYRILHLATHARADNRAGDYSFLLFYITDDSTENELLYVRDLYNLELNADMVVLSACETGLGELQRGEGVISLARAFAYAGAKSIVNTLWKVDDNSTSELMVLFYGYLKEGKEKDEALRLAKLAYIKQHGKQVMPFFWAGVIPVGDMARLW